MRQVLWGAEVELNVRYESGRPRLLWYVICLDDGDYEFDAQAVAEKVNGIGVPLAVRGLSIDDDVVAVSELLKSAFSDFADCAAWIKSTFYKVNALWPELESGCQTLLQIPPAFWAQARASGLRFEIKPSLAEALNHRYGETAAGFVQNAGDLSQRRK